MFSFCKKFNKFSKSGPARTCCRGGFTLIEMLVVLAIFVVVTGIILANLPDFKVGANIDLVAQQVALHIREAQVFAIGSVYRSTERNFAYFGIHFGKAGAGQNPGYNPSDSFILFGQKDDVADDLLGVFDGNACGNVPNNACIEMYKLPKGYKFFNLWSCVTRDTNGQNDICSGPFNITDITASIMFRRPETTASFYCSESACDSPNSSDYMVIGLKSVRDASKKRYIKVMRSGQISVLVKPSEAIAP